MNIAAFVAGVVASVVASLLVAGGAAFLRAQRARLERGSGGVWVEGIYAKGDEAFEGPISRMDIVRQIEGFSGRRVVGTIYRVYDVAQPGGVGSVRKYRVRGRAAEGQEVDYFWCTDGDGSDGTLLLTHGLRDEMRGAYMRRSTSASGPVVEEFPVRRVRVSSRKLAEFVATGAVQPDRLREVGQWPRWVKDAVADTLSLLAGSSAPSQATNDVGDV